MDKNELLDKLNNAFLTIISRNDKATRAINRELVERDNLTSDDIRQIVLKHDSSIRNDAKIYALIAVITNIINKGKDNLTLKEKRDYAPIIALVGLYSLNRPELFAKKATNIVRGQKLSGRMKGVKKSLDGYFKTNANLIAEVEGDIVRTRTVAKEEVYKNIKKRLAADEDKRAKIIKNLNKSKNVERAIRTEAHEELERGKLTHADRFGYRYKRWMTRRDDRVRRTAWHNEVDGVKIPVDSEFRAAGLLAMYPGDIRLPIGERINCRCYVVYE
jgi:hypothetical protein